MRKKVIIFAPHQDDEILSCAGTINSLKKSNAEVYIVFATNGDFCGRQSAAIRLKESMTVLEELQIKKENIITLGFADTGMDYNNSFLWRLYHSPENDILPSPISDMTYHPLGSSEYSMEQFGRHMPYTKNAFSKTVEHLIRSIRPNIIFVSSRLDAHGDHAGLCMFVEDAVNSLKSEISVYQYIIHSGDDKRWPKRENMHFSRPGNISEELWEKRLIVPVEDPLKKRHLIQMFASQISPSGYLLSFAKKEEIFFNSKEVT